MSGTEWWFVITKDAGEYDSDWNVSSYSAHTAEDALRKAMDDGYFRHGHPAMVVLQSNANLFKMRLDEVRTTDYLSPAEVTAA